MIRSLERNLLAWMLSALTLGALVLVTVSYLVTLEEMDEIFDENLKQAALTVATYHRFDSPQRPRTHDELPKLPRVYEEEGDFDFVTLTWHPDGRLAFTSDPAVVLPHVAASGISRVQAGPELWHVYTITTPEGVVQAAQRATTRKVLAAEAASELFMPFLVLIALIGLLLVVALRRGLRPLDSAAADVAARSAASLEPIAEDGLPREIFPLIRAINGLMQRLSAAFSAQRRFVADAAHELRSPLTALRLQVQLLERARTEERRASGLSELQAGIDRSQHLVEQLLHLSRVEPDGAAARLTTVDLSELARSVVGTFSAEAQAKGIDVGADAAQPALVSADPAQLQVLLNNLVSNAIRYTPAGGTVDVRVREEGNRAVLQVIDSGPGIPEAERERVFDRFHRGESRQIDGGIPGSGLGLAIVQAIAVRHGARVSLHDPVHGGGLEVRVELAMPRRPA